MLGHKLGRSTNTKRAGRQTNKEVDSQLFLYYFNPKKSLNYHGHCLSASLSVLGPVDLSLDLRVTNLLSACHLSVSLSVCLSGRLTSWLDPELADLFLLFFGLGTSDFQWVRLCSIQKLINLPVITISQDAWKII